MTYEAAEEAEPASREVAATGFVSGASIELTTVDVGGSWAMKCSSVLLWTPAVVGDLGSRLCPDLLWR